jgi:hypothetical protein
MISSLRGLSIGTALLAFVQGPGSAGAVQLRAIEDVPSIRTYRMDAQLQAGVAPRFQATAVKAFYGKDPERYSIRVELTEGEREPIPIEARLVDGTIYFRMKTQWAPVEKFHLAEMTVITPRHLLGIGDRLDEVGREELHGRSVIHLRGDKSDLPPVRSGSESMDFSKMDHATVDLWVDREEHFIVRMHIAAEGTERGQALPVDIRFEYSEFNVPIAVEAPTTDETVHVEQPRQPSQADVDRKLGFVFPIPEGSHAAIYGATVSLLTNMPLAEARAYADRSMAGAGFQSVEVVERAPGEFYTDYERNGRTVGVAVFQVTERGATIQVNALKMAP